MSNDETATADDDPIATQMMRLKKMRTQMRGTPRQRNVAGLALFWAEVEREGGGTAEYRIAEARNLIDQMEKGT